jgi:hypothetical protein
VALSVKLGVATFGQVIRLTIALCVFIVLWADSSIGQPGGLNDIYTTRAVVTGQMRETDPSVSDFVLKTFWSKYLVTPAF